jgi:hypothetical protein
MLKTLFAKDTDTSNDQAYTDTAARECLMNRVTQVLQQSSVKSEKYSSFSGLRQV